MNGALGVSTGRTINWAYKSDDTVPLQSRAHFDFLGIDMINGDGLLDENKLLASLLVPEDHPPPGFLREQLQSARACGLSFVARDRFPRFRTVCSLAAGRGACSSW